MDPCRLNVLSGQLVLPAVAATAAGTVPSWDTPDDPATGFSFVMRGVAGRSKPRVVMLASAFPCDVRLVWTGGGGFGSSLYMTLSGGRGRVQIDAKDITIEALNRVNANNQLFTSISDGEQQTRNAWVGEWAQAAPPASGFIRIPPYSEGLRATSNLGAASAATLQLQNGYGTQTGITPVLDANVDPAIVAGAAAVAVAGLAAGEIVTLNFDLGL